MTLHTVVVEQPLLPGGATDRSPDPTHGVSPKALKNLPADVGLFSFSEEHLRLPHLDSRWITVSPASNSGQNWGHPVGKVETATIPAETIEKPIQLVGSDDEW